MKIHELIDKLARYPENTEIGINATELKSLIDPRSAYKKGNVSITITYCLDLDIDKSIPEGVENIENYIEEEIVDGVEWDLDDSDPLLAGVTSHFNIDDVSIDLYEA